MSSKEQVPLGRVRADAPATNDSAANLSIVAILTTVTNVNVWLIDTYQERQRERYFFIYLYEYDHHLRNDDGLLRELILFAVHGGIGGSDCQRMLISSNRLVNLSSRK